MAFHLPPQAFFVALYHYFVLTGKDINLQETPFCLI